MIGGASGLLLQSLTGLIIDVSLLTNSDWVGWPDTVWRSIHCFDCILQGLHLPSVLWRCWLGVRKGIQPVKNMEWWGAGVVICLERAANDLHMVQLMPLPPRYLLLQQNPEWFILLVPAYPGCPGKKAVKRLYVCLLHLPGRPGISWNFVNLENAWKTFGI